MREEQGLADSTVYDVAKAAGVSIATVSRVLNAPEKVRPATRARVLAAVDALSFVPRAAAAERARKAPSRIGVLAPFFTRPSFVQRLRGVAGALAGSPCELIIYSVDCAARRDEYLTRLAVTHRVDGLIVMALTCSQAAAQRLTAHGLETVFIEHAHPWFSSIEIDDAQGGKLAAEYLLSKGHRRCAFVGDNDRADHAIHPSRRRLAGFRAALEAAGVPLPELYVSLAPHGLEEARGQAQRLLDLPERPSAIFAASDTQAMGVLKAALERGLRVPDDLAMVGFDDLDTADFIGLTTVRQPLEESGRIAVELLFARLADPSRPVQHVRLPLEVVPRTTA